jgi:hypothetical protein
MFYSQAGQDLFVNETLNSKKNGYFLEIGSNDYKMHNNTYFLEKILNWKGIMVEYDGNFLNNYKKYRSNSIHIIQDATKVNYLKLLIDNKVPKDIDYLQIDLDVDNRSTLTTLEIFDKEIFDKYKFATITFETDIYRGNFYDTRESSRAIFEKHGYKLVYPDVNITYQGKLLGPFEDWWVHPDLVNTDKLIEKIDYKCPNGCCISHSVKI